MGYCNATMGSWGWLNALFSLLVLGLIAGGAFFLIRRYSTGVASAPAATAGAEGILAERYARGEIDEQEYQQRLATLRAGK